MLDSSFRCLDKEGKRPQKSSPPSFFPTALLLTTIVIILEHTENSGANIQVLEGRDHTQPTPPHRPAGAGHNWLVCMKRMKRGRFTPCPCMVYSEDPFVWVGGDWETSHYSFCPAPPNQPANCSFPLPRALAHSLEPCSCWLAALPDG